MAPEAPENVHAAENSGEHTSPDVENNSGPSDDENDSDNRSISSGVSSDSDEERFLRDPTISQDDTFTKAAQNKRLLSQMGDQLEQDSSSLHLLSSGPAEPITTPWGVRRFEPPGLPVPGLWRRPMPPLPRGQQPEPTSSGGARKTDSVQMPRFKITKDAKWRLESSKKRDKEEVLQNGHPRVAVEEGSIATSPEASAEAYSSTETGKVLGKEENLTQLKAGDSKLAVQRDVLTSIQSDLQAAHAAEQSNKAGLAQSLARIGEQHLGFDISDNSQGISLYIGYLLDTIQMLQSEVHFAQAGYESESDTDNEGEKRPEENKVLVPRGQVLHRIYCSNQQHKHNKDIYVDEPKLRSNAYERSPGLVAKTKVTNLSAYLVRHPDVAFVVFREHTCVQDIDPFATIMPLERLVASENGERLKIVSPKLQRAIDQVAEFPFHLHSRFETTIPSEMDAPYNFMFHHRKKLADHIKENPDLEADVQPLLDFLAKNYGEEYEQAEALLSRHVITTPHLGKLFKPNQMVLSKKSGVQEAFILETYADIKTTKVYLDGWAWQYDGTQLLRRVWSGSMDLVPEGEEVAISSLNIYPVEFAKKKDVEKIEARGRKAWDMKGQVYASYTGWDRNKTYQYVGARFMVDVATYQLMHGNALMHTRSYDRSSKYDTEPLSIDREETLSTKNLMLLPPTIFGFSLQEKKWVILNVENFSPIDWNDQAFKRLVLDEKIKEMIYALVEVQKTAEKMDDIISGKGNGLIILLHGSPGTGKTLTAESVAEIAKKPLYRVTCGDIGTEAQQVEKYIKTVLYLGKIWDCVLLLDEADVFLEERTMADLQRNSLVSVFLRILEYYEGILILTSNRVGTFDEAFKSRIQVAIHYDNLTRKSRKAIWNNFFKMIEESPQEDANMAELERRLDELAAEEMNGRQIRNALLTARQLAKHRKERLDWSHLSQVIRTSAAFNKYLKAVRGHTDEQWARDEMLR